MLDGGYGQREGRGVTANEWDRFSGFFVVVVVVSSKRMMKCPGITQGDSVQLFEFYTKKLLNYTI